MKHELNQIYQSWTRFLSDDDLPLNDANTLCDSLQQNSRLRDEMLADERMHRLLAAQTHLKNTEDLFVQQVVSRCLAEGMISEPSNREAVTQVEVFANVVPPPIERSYSHFPDLAVGDNLQPSQYSRLRRTESGSMDRLAVVAAVLLLFGFGVMTGLMLPRQGPVTTMAEQVELEGNLTPKERSDLQPVDAEVPSTDVLVDQKGVDRSDKLIDSAQPLNLEPRIVEMAELNREGPDTSEDPIELADLEHASLGESSDSPDIDSLPNSQRTFALLTRLDATGEPDHGVTAERIGERSLQFANGDARISFDHGGVFRITAPAQIEVISDREILLNQGKLVAKVTTNNPDFNVRTPTALVINRGEQFDVRVDDAGTTEVFVQRGKVDVEPWRGFQGLPEQTWQLGAGRLNRSVIYHPLDGNTRGPMAAIASGPNGRFVGLLGFNGKMHEFHSPEKFTKFRQGLTERYWASLSPVFEDWSNALNLLGNGPPKGFVNVNGVKADFVGIDAMLNLNDRLVSEQNARNPSQAESGNRSFRGSININGKEHVFNSETEFNEARQRLLDPLRNFGIAFPGRLRKQE